MHSVNPFNPHSVVTPSLFAGRASQVNEMCSKLTQLKDGRPASFFIYGDRGIGKTALASLIKHVSSANLEKLHELNLLTSYYTVDEEQSIISVIQQSVNKILEQQDKSFLSNIQARVSHLFQNNKFTIAIPTVATVSVENKGTTEKPETTIKDETVSILSQILKETKDGENKKDGALIIIDEIHNIKDISSVALLLRNILTTLTVDGYGNISFLLIGYESDMRDFFAKDSSSRRFFDLVPLGVMPDGEAYEILSKGLEKINIKWDDDALKSVVKASGGYPHSLQLVGHNLVQLDTDSFINKDDAAGAIVETAVQLQTKDFSPMYSFNKKMTNNDKLLAYMVSLEEPITRKAVIDSKVCSNIVRSLAELKKEGAIKEDSEGVLTFHSQLFKTAVRFDQYIRKYIPPSTPVTTPEQSGH